MTDIFDVIVFFVKNIAYIIKIFCIFCKRLFENIKTIQFALFVELTLPFRTYSLTLCFLQRYLWPSLAAKEPRPRSLICDECQYRRLPLKIHFEGSKHLLVAKRYLTRHENALPAHTYPCLPLPAFCRFSVSAVLIFHGLGAAGFDARVKYSIEFIKVKVKRTADACLEILMSTSLSSKLFKKHFLLSLSRADFVC